MIGNIAAGLFGIPTAPVTNSFESIATLSVGSGGQANVEFTSIPSTYKHLQIRGIIRTNRALGYDTMKITANGSTSYSAHQLSGDGATPQGAGNGSRTSIDYNTIAGNNATASVFAGVIIDVLDYANTTTNKTFRYLNGYDSNGSGYIALSSGALLSTSAISSIKIEPQSGTLLQQYTTFALYGLRDS